MGQYSRRRVFRQLAILSSPHVETLHFELFDELAILLDHVDGGVLLLRVKQDPAEDIINVDLKKPVAVVDLLLELVANLQGMS